MSLIYIKEVDGNSILGVWEMDDALESLAKQSPSTEKLSAPTLKRKKENIATRLLMDAMYAGAEINYHASGKPYLLNNEMYISISHSGNLVCLLLNKSNSVGVDIQFINPKITLLKEKFLSKTEIAQLPPECETDALHIYWGAKEALYKYYGEENIIFKTRFHIDAFAISNTGKIKGTILSTHQKAIIPLHYEKWNDYFLVYTIE